MKGLDQLRYIRVIVCNQDNSLWLLFPWKIPTSPVLKIIKQREGIIIRVPGQVDGKIEKQVILNDNADAKSFVVIRTKFWK